METIFKLYEQAKDPNYVGQEKNARELLDISSKYYLTLEKLQEVEYDQEKQTKYYEIIRWTVNQLASEYRDRG
jgi:hypothetical protein